MLGGCRDCGCCEDDASRCGPPSREINVAGWAGGLRRADGGRFRSSFCWAERRRLLRRYSRSRGDWSSILRWWVFGRGLGWWEGVASSMMVLST